jgi:threonine 3-dehydrogenase
MRKPAILIAGANGEVGHALIRHFAEHAPAMAILAADLLPLDERLRPLCHRVFQSDILDRGWLQQIGAEYEIRAIYHLAAILSTRAELQPGLAHRVNVEGTLALLDFADDQSQQQGQPVRFLFPSSIAVFGMPSLEVKQSSPPVKEDEWLQPITMYGCNKLYCEHLGRYFARHYRQLEARHAQPHVDFRAVRFPGLISAATVPTGGTSDFAPEMLHGAARGEPYACFVREDARIPFMAMPDAVRALVDLAAAPREALSRQVYNVTSFSLSAGEIAGQVRLAFPDARITFSPDTRRQRIVDSWPAALDDRAARDEWGWQPHYDARRTFDDYLVPGVLARYNKEAASE